ncbi:hypothetical protein LCGC14_1415770 [marine sediment metagenome]|uniref:Uncharacterized protein n=1 Tax=marine sediment metagenome TaxID=412755 RepID=A0A0F9JTA2_9ZZZZ
MDLKRIFINMGVLALISFGLMAYISTTQTENNVEFPITNNTLINESYGFLSSNLTGVQDNSQQTLNTFQNVTPNENLGVWQVTPIVSPARTVKTMTLGMWNILIKLPTTILGVSPIVASLINGFLIVLIILGMWAWWKGVFQ